MKSVLIAIRPKWVERITSGQKTIEVRKTAPQEVPFKCYIYETKGQYVKFTHGAHTKYGYGRGKVIGEFICDKVYPIKNRGSSFVVANEEQGVTNQIAGQSCLYYDDMVSYFGNKDGFGWHIGDLKIYDKPKELSEFYKPCSQSKNLDCDWLRNHNVCSCSEEKSITRAPQSWQYVKEREE